MSEIKFKIGDKVAVIPRFGENGEIKEISDNKFGLAFNNLPFVLWFDEDELEYQTGEGFSWLRI